MIQNFIPIIVLALSPFSAGAALQCAPHQLLDDNPDYDITTDDDRCVDMCKPGERYYGSGRCFKIDPVQERILSCTQECLKSDKYPNERSSVDRASKCSNACQNPKADFSTKEDGTVRPFGPAENKYKDRYIQKCMGAYNNDPDSALCCGELAIADTKVMQKRGVFDTPTTAELSIIVDEVKCKPKEYKYSCSGPSILDLEKDECKKYVNRCMEFGRWSGYEEKTRLKRCQSAYSFNAPMELNNDEKYIAICMRSKSPENTASDKLASECGSDYLRDLANYRNHCVLEMNNIKYSRFANWFFQIRAFMFKKRRALYEAQTAECLKRYGEELGQKLGN